MSKRVLGRSGLHVQPLALGERNIGVQGHYRAIGWHLRVRVKPVQAERPAAHEDQLLQPW